MPQEPQTQQPAAQPDEFPLTRLEILAERIEQLSRDTVNTLDLIDERFTLAHVKELEALKRIEALCENTLGELRLFVRDRD